MVLGGTEPLVQPGAKRDRVYVLLLCAATILVFAIAAASRYKTDDDPRFRVGRFTAASFVSLMGAVACGLMLVAFVDWYFPELLAPLLMMALFRVIPSLLLLEGWLKDDTRDLKDVMVTGI